MVNSLKYFDWTWFEKTWCGLNELRNKIFLIQVKPPEVLLGTRRNKSHWPIDSFHLPMKRVYSKSNINVSLDKIAAEENLIIAKSSCLDPVWEWIHNELNKYHKESIITIVLLPTVKIHSVFQQQTNRLSHEDTHIISISKQWAYGFGGFLNHLIITLN